MNEFISKLSTRKRSSLASGINVTPFVDVMLVLLIIFMITSPMLVSGISVDLPETKTSPVAGDDEPLSVSVDKAGGIFINDSRISYSSLPAKLKAITKENYKLRIFVRGDKAADYGAVMKVIGAIRETGFTKVALITNVEQ